MFANTLHMYISGVFAKTISTKYPEDYKLEENAKFGFERSFTKKCGKILEIEETKK